MGSRCLQRRRMLLFTPRRLMFLWGQSCQYQRSIILLATSRCCFLTDLFELQHQMIDLQATSEGKNKRQRKAIWGTGTSWLLVITLYALVVRVHSLNSITDNTCTFKEGGKLFSLVYLNRASSGKYYEIAVNNSASVIFNFCDPFVPADCPITQTKAYTFLKVKNGPGNTEPYTCTPYSSSSKTSNYLPQYISEKGQISLNLTLLTELAEGQVYRTTDIVLQCEQSDDGSLKDIKLEKLTEVKLIIHGQTPYGCPVFQLSSIWMALTDNSFIFGIILFVIGFIMLFFGILMTHLMIFLTAYFLSFALLTGIFTAFLDIDSSRVVIYFSLLFILFLSTLIAYGLTKLVNVSIFFIGAFFGFIVAAIVNSIFCKMFGVYSVWSLVFFEVVLTIPFGLLTFKYSEQVIVMSTSLAGSYMIVRPISWIFGGFPNEFTLYQLVEDGQLKTLPWTFFLYLIFIIAIAILGALYQILKIKRQRPNETIETNFITENVEEHIDRIRDAVQKIIVKYAPESNDEDYKQMKEMENIKFEEVVEQPAKTKERKSRENVF